MKIVIQTLEHSLGNTCGTFFKFVGHAVNMIIHLSMSTITRMYKVVLEKMYDRVDKVLHCS